MTDDSPNPNLKKTLKPQDLILRFVDSLGHARDAEIYLNLFASKGSFAIIAIDEDILREEMEAVIFNLRFLMRLELTPIVMLLAPRDKIVELDVENAFKKAKLSIHFPGAEMPELATYEHIQGCLKKKISPVLFPDPKASLAGEMAKLAYELQTQKIIFLKRSGGLFDQKKPGLISIVNLRDELQELVDSDRLSDDDKALLRLCDEIIAVSQHKIFISIVNPLNLIRELFTVKGAGTLVQMGSQILSYTSWKDIDKEQLKKLLEISFQKKIRDDFFKTKVDHFYVEEGYQGAALLSSHGDMVYLSKFAVGTEARGLGVGRDLWNTILKHHNKIFWRADPNKFISSWYVKQCDGMHRTPEWVVYWKGIDQSKINRAIELALKQPVDFASE